MNYRLIFHTLGKILLVEAGLLLLPLLVSIIYQERSLYFPFIISILILVLISSMLIFFIKKDNSSFFAKEGFMIVSLGWIFISLFGCLPFIISKEIPNFFDAFFETVSGFTTTGSTILSDIESISKGLLFWRSFSHWIGGMGILVFVLAFLPNIDPRSMYILKAESPGPQVGKLVSKIKITARILYGIYLFLTLFQILLLVVGDMPLFDSVVNALATAGTGGFSIKNNSIAAYNSIYSEIIITIFMFLFAINFNLFYFILIGQGKRLFKNEELRWYLGIIVFAILIITLNTLSTFNNMSEALRYSSFQVASIISTTGFSTIDFNSWPELSKWTLVILMLTGGCAGATCGGIKISRIAILSKTVLSEIRNALHPHQITTIRFEGKKVDNHVIKGVAAFIIAYFFILIIGTLVISVDNLDSVTNFTAVISCLNNIGPGLSSIGPLGNFSIFSNFSKFFLSLIMLTGRLEIFPMLILFSPKLWRKY